MAFNPVEEVIIVRHGVAQHNVAAKIHGESEYYNDKWRHSALIDPKLDGDKVHASLLKLGIDVRYGTNEVVCFTSPLIRAMETMYATLGSNRAKLYSHDSLIERQGQGHPCNTREHMNILTVRHHDVEFLDGVAELHDPPAPEPYHAIRTKVSAFVEKFVKCHLAPNKVILLFSHHDTIEAFTGISLKNSEPIIYNTRTGGARKI